MRRASLSRRGPLSGPLLAAAALAVLLACRPAAAEDAATTARAQTLFADGRAAIEKGDYATACARFEESLALVKRASTLLNLAQCEQQMDRLASSARHWREGIALLSPGDERANVSKERAAAVEARLPHLKVTLTAPAPPGSRIEVDGVLVPLDQVTSGVPVDPGRHAVALLVPGAADQRSTVDIRERETKTVTLTPPAAGTSPKAEPSGGGGLRAGGFALIGVGAAGFIVAGVTGGMLLSKHSTITADCTGPTHACSPAGTSALDATPPLNIANAAGWTAGIVGLAGGVIMVVLGSRAQTAVTPTALPGGGGFWVTRRF